MENLAEYGPIGAIVVLASVVADLTRRSVGRRQNNNGISYNSADRQTLERLDTNVATMQRDLLTATTTQTEVLKGIHEELRRGGR